MVAEAHGGGCVQRPVLRIGGIDCQATCRARPGPPRACAARAAPRRSRSGRRRSRGRAPAPPRAATAHRRTPRAGGTDARQQTHRLDVIAVREQERADHFLGRRQVAVAEQPGRRDHFLRQRLEFRDVGRGPARVVGVAAHPVEAFQHAPARRQRRVDRDGSEECLDGLRRVLHRHVAMAALLIETAVAGMEPLELTQASRARPRSG